MRKANSNSWGRMVLAFAAVLVVAGPGMVLAGGDGSQYNDPKLAVLLGPRTVAAGGTEPYSLKVTFTDGTEATYTGAPATFNAVKGSFSGNTYSAPGDTGRDGLTGSFTGNGKTATGQKIISVQ